ncbi:MAG: hypothetical protein FGM42_10995, partial [Ilumatobacteraceae bacterium]|nr:hypothetical protein [Ilumatobacteraceae bacterium]
MDCARGAEHGGTNRSHEPLRAGRQGRCPDDGHLEVTGLEAHLRARRDEGRKLLVPYVTGGLTNWKEGIRAAVAAGADAVEVGIPFSDPVMDGPVIQDASQRALEAGATPPGILAEIPTIDVQVPIVVMLYYNTVFRTGHE